MEESPPPQAADTLPLSRECRKTLAFALSLENHQEYYRAVTEHMRRRFECGASVRDECDLAIARCLYRSAAYADLAVWGEAAIEPGRSPVSARLRFLAGIGRYELGDYDEAARDFRKACEWGVGSAVASVGAINASLALARDGRFEDARATLRPILDSAPNESPASAYLECIDAAAAFRPKSRTLAGALALVPGLGYGYTGHWQTALVTAGLVGLSAWGLAAATDDENYGTTAVLGFFTFAWYGGSIYGSRQAAGRCNERALEDLLRPAELLCPEWVLEEGVGTTDE